MKKYLLLFITILFYITSHAQLLNGSFEGAGNGNMEHWIETCAAPELVEDTPPNGGQWSLKVWPGNAQACFPGYVYQILPFINDQDAYPIQVEGWAKTSENNVVGIHFAKMGLNGDITLLNGDTTSADDWTKLIIRDTFEINKEETALLLIHTGLIGGPGNPSLFSFVDKFVLSEITTGVQKQYDTLLGIISDPKPNPASQTTFIDVHLPQKVQAGQMVFYNSLGQLMKKYVIENPIEQLEIILNDYAIGTYYYRFESDQGVSETKKIIVLE